MRLFLLGAGTLQIATLYASVEKIIINGKPAFAVVPVSVGLILVSLGLHRVRRSLR